MAITILDVVQTRKFSYSHLSKTASTEYFVFFSTDTQAEYADYVKKASMCLTAQAPSGPYDITNKIPQIGDEFKSNTTTTTLPVFVNKVTPELYKDQNNWWLVKVDYTIDDATREELDRQDQLNDDPENIAAEFYWGQTNRKKTIYVDKTLPADGGPLPIVSSSGDGFTKLPQIDVAIGTLSVRRKKNTYSALAALALVNKLNDANLTLDGEVFPKGTVKLVAWKSQSKTAIVTKPGIPATTVSYKDQTRVYHIDLEGWVGEIFDQGLSEFAESGADGGPVGKRVFTRFGQPLRSPQPLNGLGLRIYDDNGELIVANTPVDQPIIGLNGRPGVKAFTVGAAGAKLCMLLFNFYEYADLSVLGDNA